VASEVGSPTACPIKANRTVDSLVSMILLRRTRPSPKSKLMAALRNRRDRVMVQALVSARAMHLQPWE
jgi:hypothetical protein